MQFFLKRNFISLLLCLVVQSYGAYAFEPLCIGSVGRSFDKTIFDNFAGQLGVIEETKKPIKLFILAPKELVSVDTAQRQVATYRKMLEAYLSSLPPESLPNYMDFIAFINQLPVMRNHDALKLEIKLFKHLSLHSKNYVRILFNDRPEQAWINQFNVRFLLELINAAQKDSQNSRAKKELKAKIVQYQQENTLPRETPKRKLARTARQAGVSIKENVEHYSDDSLKFLGEE